MSKDIVFINSTFTKFCPISDINFEVKEKVEMLKEEMEKAQKVGETSLHTLPTCTIVT